MMQPNRATLSFLLGRGQQQQRRKERPNLTH
uniref:Uncharacterized protein n=1 Tax=Tetranychus urticae TaxID=32264 RepID=T1KS74_TETUR